MAKSRIFIVEDEAIVAADLAERLDKLGFEVAGTADTGERALAAIPGARVDVVLMDIVLKGPIDGIETTRRLQQSCDLPVIYLTAHADSRTMQSAIDTDPYGYVLKPFNDRELQVAIRIALHRHGAEAKLRRLERWMATMLSSIGDGVVATDTRGRITLLNAAAQRLTGWSDHEALGRKFDEVFRIIDAHSARPITGVIERGSAEGFELGVDESLLLQRRIGKPVPIDDSIAPIRGEQGEASGVVLVFRDATQRLAAERLQREKLAAEMASEQKSRFLSRVSHELRTPLHAIIGFTQLLQMDTASPLNATQRQRVELVHAAGQHLLHLINDLLDLGRIEQGARPLQLQPVDVDRVFREAVDLVAAEATRCGVQVRRSQLPDALHVQADPRALVQVLINLLSNGIKYSRPGGIVSVDVAAGEQQVEIGIANQGPELTPLQLAQLFQPFNRLGAENSAVAGSGLGLVIAKSLIEAMGGSINATSKPEVGTRFAVVLRRVESPRAVTGARTVAAVADAQAAPRAATLLYIEDDPVNALLFSEALAHVPQWRVILADDGTQGLDMARRLLPDLIIADINLPGLSGHEIVRALRADPATAGLRCIALSADAQPDQVEAGKASGFDSYWTKPLALAGLADRLAQWLPHREE